VATPTATALRPAHAPRFAWPIALVFVAGTAIGAISSAAVISQVSGGAGAPSVVEPGAADSQLTRLLSNMEAAAQRGDTRLFVTFRQDLAELIGTVGMAEYRSLRGIDTSGE
jgi:hypothetical protein